MKVSIAMTTHNGAKYIKEQLESFSSQTRLPDELIVCDDASSDSTLHILEEFAKSAPFKMKIFRNESNLGCSRNFEKSLALCSGDYMFLSDQDDVWFPEKISCMLAEFERNPWAHLVICDAEFCDEYGNLHNMTVMKKTYELRKDKSFHINGACTALSKKLVEFILPFPVDNCAFYDVYINRWVSLMENKALLEKPLQVWRIHGNNKTSSMMTDHNPMSIYQEHVLSKNADTASYWKIILLEHIELLNVLNNNCERHSLDELTKVSRKAIVAKINKAIEAYTQRLLIIESGWYIRKVLAVRMLLSGNYRFFSNYLSFLKDISR